jgi:hypothetical protein
MAITVAQGFQTLRANLEITGLQSTTVATRQKNVREAVEGEMDVLSSFLTGSYSRSTMISPLKEADVDIFVVLDPKYYEPAAQASLLDRVKRVLKNTYPKTPDISRNGRAVTITFSDFKVDVVPAFNRTGGGYIIPDSIEKRWVSTNPQMHVKIWSEANKEHGGDLVPVIKMMKCWNKTHSAMFRSFHLETLVLKVLTGIKISDFPSGVRYVFDKARNHVAFPLSDPAGYDVVGGFQSVAEQQEVLSRLESAYNRARSAESLNAQNRVSEAFDKWRLLFDEYFPTYG